MTDGDWGSRRLEVVHGEARAVLDAQNEAMGEIDGKATKTVRFNAILIGLLLTASRVAGPETFHGRLLHLSLAALVCSAVVGIVTYNESNLYLGPGRRYFDATVQSADSNRNWDVHLIEGYAGMILENDEILEWNSWLLTVTQGMLILGVVGAVLATAI